MMRLDFYYFSYQCPLNDTMIQLLQSYSDRIDIHFHDVSHDHTLAKEVKLFFPTLTILNHEKRYYDPLTPDFLDEVVKGNYPEIYPDIPTFSTIEKTINITPLEKEYIELACACCGNKTETNCQKKKEFLLSHPQTIYGFIHQDETGNLLAGAEFMDSKDIPYPISLQENTAFLTCVYSLTNEFDYKSAPLKALENYLKQSYSKVIVISDELGNFPNGNLEFFIRNGYQDEGIVYEDKKYCRLHLLSKDLGDY